ncbi:MAG: amphi-Trp domain-containing protein [Rhodobacterales bacterium]|nr:MAG: amphi-Trp domain-containing protein [Rhodobacterales bacterium]
MGREVKLFKSEERQSRESVCAFLRQMADKISAGQVTLSQGKESITLNMPETLILDVQVEDEDKRRKGTQHSLEIEIKWFDDMAGGGPLSLS